MLRGAPSSHPAVPDLVDEFDWLRAETFNVLVGVVCVLLWLAAMPYTLRADSFVPGWGVLVAMIAIAAASYTLRGRLRLASALLTGDLLLGSTAFLFDRTEQGMVPFLFVPSVLVAGALLGTRGAFATAAIASVAVIGAKPLGASAIALGASLSALGIVWLTALTSWTSTKGLYTALHWAWANSEQAERNLAESRDYQARLARALRQLEEANYRLECANQALSQARGEAEQGRRLKAQFAANVSHELRTPLNLVVGFTDLMLNTPESYGDVVLPDAYLADLTVVNRAAKHLRGLVDDILDLSQVDAGAMPVLKERTDVGEVVGEAVATARPLLDRKGLAVRVEIEPNLPIVPVDRLRIRQVLLNLLNNAARFTDFGGVTVTARVSEGAILVEVTDTGVGIEPAKLAKAFEPFRQLDDSPTGGRGGTGLGLAISRRFVELHGGAIWGRSTGVFGEGSTFSFTIPIDPGETAQGTRIGLSDGYSTLVRRWESPAEPPKSTVVVVDDDPAIVRLFERHLSGFQVVGVSGEAEAVAAAIKSRAEALIVDLPTEARLDEWNVRWGKVTAREGIRVLGCPMPSGKRIAHSLGLVDYLVKPVTREALLASISVVAPDARTALVVDDDPRMVRLISRMLRSSPNLQPLRAHGGQEALDLMRRTRPDIVLLDLLMPQVDGLTVLETMRADPGLAGIPVVAVSARGALEAITPSSSRTMMMVADVPLAVSQLLGSVEAILKSSPPMMRVESSSVRELRAQPSE